METYNIKGVIATNTIYLMKHNVKWLFTYDLRLIYNQLAVFSLYFKDKFNNKNYIEILEGRDNDFTLPLGMGE